MDSFILNFVYLNLGIYMYFPCFSDMNHQQTESFSSSSSSNNRKLSIPKSPDNKLGSPRLCLKFQREISGQISQKARDSKEPQYKSYSVTSVTVDSSDNPMFSPGDSPASSVNSDMYNPMFDSMTNFSRNRLKMPVSEETKTSAKQFNLLHHVEGNGPSLMELGNVQGNNFSDRINNRHSVLNMLGNSNTNNKIGLKTIETQPFSPHLNWSDSQKLDYELPDLEEISNSHIPLVEESSNHIGNSREPSITSPSNGLFSRYNQSTVSSSFGLNSCTLSSTINSLDLNNKSERLDKSEKSNSNGVGSSTQKSKVVTSQSDSVNNINSFSDALSGISGLKWDLRSAASPKSEDGSVHSNKSDSLRTSSPSRQEKSDRESRPSTPKVPPLKIIIPAKSSSSATVEADKLKVHVTKTALPYVINPTQDQQAEAAGKLLALGEIPAKSAESSQAPSPMSQTLISTSPTIGEQNNINAETSDKIEEDNNSKVVLENCSDGLDTLEKLNDDSDVPKSENDTKKDEPVQRVLRSSVRSQTQQPQSKQQQQQQKQEKMEKSSKS